MVVFFFLSQLIAKQDRVATYYCLTLFDANILLLRAEDYSSLQVLGCVKSWSLRPESHPTPPKAAPGSSLKGSFQRLVYSGKDGILDFTAEKNVWMS